MSESTVRSVLRILAIACVTIGVILTAQSVCAALMMKSVTGGSFGGLSLNVPGAGGLSFWAIAAQMITPVIGLLLYGASGALAERVVST